MSAARRTTWPGRWTVMAAICMLLSLAACGGGEEDPGGGHATLQFTGAVTGTLDEDLEVNCYLPAQPGDDFEVKMDSDSGKTVGDRELTSFDFRLPEYGGPRTYDLGSELQSEKFDGEGLFLLFEELEKAPFIWGADQRSSGTVTIDASQRSGRVTLRGWENGDKMRVDVDGTFRCGDRKTQDS